MKIKKFYLYLLLYFVGYGYSGDQVENNHTVSKWSFLKISETDLFFESSEDTKQSLNTQYGQVKITLDDNKLTINNELLEHDLICSIDFIKIKKTPTEYFLSEKTKDLYVRFFRKEETPLFSHIYIITSSKPEKECEVPYNEIIENNGYLIIVDKEYLVFFKSRHDDIFLMEAASKILKLMIARDSETIGYVFKENVNGTELKIDVETRY